MSKSQKTEPEQKVVAVEATQRNSASTRMRILHAAEAEFADHGFDGVSVRQIALHADVPVALINYHFGSKEGLYRAIFEMRAPMIIDQRIAGLRLAEMEPEQDRKVEMIVKAVLVPNLHMRSTEKNSSYARILAREVSDPKSHHRKVVAEFFDPIAYKVIEALQQAMPDRTIEEINWGYQAMLGVMVYTMADTGRISRLSGGRCDPEDELTTATHLVALMKAALLYSRVPKPQT
ncbi:TetR/AcrR family transcriptional regulator [Mesorhizobium sp. J428]|uniref:TetR/AcrR family transcriptional regulator n=1 Tax=Mesorhizobium sp. J428 TaxID=2898440 RepID=UPI0021517B38|nr:TetR/AcrR family transcriptional regulator [Mesorhizobium sp. J428]MCR5856698.1 TetR family transcriptional regulator [Mesorhizobium sp. J428]